MKEESCPEAFVDYGQWYDLCKDNYATEKENSGFLYIFNIPGKSKYLKLVNHQKPIPHVLMKETNLNHCQVPCSVSSSYEFLCGSYIFAIATKKQFQNDGTRTNYTLLSYSVITGLERRAVRREENPIGVTSTVA